VHGRPEEVSESSRWRPGWIVSTGVELQPGPGADRVGLMGQWPARLTLEKWSRVDDNHFERGRGVLRPHIPPRLEQHPLDDGRSGKAQSVTVSTA
jgi:hypothetical protein